MPVGKISLAEADERLADGLRRTGEFVYKTKCPTCDACQPVRIDCSQFEFSKNQKRILSRNNGQLDIRIGPLMADNQRVALFNKHRRQRGLAKRDHDIDLEEYIWGFVRSCFDSFELTYWIQDRLVCLAVCDRGKQSVSAVYTFFDPDLSKESLGTYSILKQIEYCQDRSPKYLYLGYYVQNSPHMAYKERFLPQQRLIDNQWVDFGTS
jgi:arginine-tRNA-protein transferase